MTDNEKTPNYILHTNKQTNKQTTVTATAEQGEHREG